MNVNSKDTIFKKKAAERLKRLMQEHNLNEQELADAAGLTQPTINNILNEVYRSYKSAFLLGLHFKVNPLWIAGMVDEEHRPLSEYESSLMPKLESEVNILTTHKESLDSYIQLLNDKLRIKDKEIKRLSCGGIGNFE